MKKVLLVATVQSHIAQFHKPLVELLRKNEYEIHVAAKNNLFEKNGLALPEVDKVFDIPFSRYPFDFGNIKAYKILKEIINNENYDFVHCNTPVGGVVARLAARKQRKQDCKVIYTAHGFHFYKGASIKNWFLYYPIEKILSRITDVLITITKEDYCLVKNKFKCRVCYINGCGVDDKRFLSVSNSDVLELKKQYGLEHKFVALCTGELNNNKNQKFLIDVVEKVSKTIPNFCLILAGNGPNEEELKQLVKQKNLENNVLMIGYRSDIEKYVNACDIVISASLREGLPFNIIEAMICKKPIIASNNRGHRELIIDNVNGFIFEHESIDKCVNLIKKLYSDKDLRNKLIEQSEHRSAIYTVASVQKELETIYRTI